MQTLTREAGTGRDGKRNRPPTSCEPCRTRKLKCNRGSPCDTCVKRSKQSSCHYADNANRNKPKRDKTGDRLQNLENLVLQLVQNGSPRNHGQEIVSTEKIADNSRGSAMTEAKPVEERGTLHVQDGQMNFVDSSHWLSILHDIKEVRESLLNTEMQENESVGAVSPEPETDLVFGALQLPTLREIIWSLPSRSVCDSLLSQYFNMQFFVIPVLHPLQFQREYEQFWQDSTKSPTLFIGLLFAILGIMVTIRHLTNTPIEPGREIISPDTFRLRTTQCLVLRKYSTGRCYGIETLVLHLQSNLLGLVDSSINLWFLMGIIIRLAMRMGYHRDSGNHPNISPFEGEMRRRVWAVIFQLDVLMSFQLGLPSMIPTDYCDTKPPNNLQYSDFSPGSAVFPPSRPLSDQTSVLYFIVKSKIMNVFKNILAHTQSLTLPPLETTIMLDLEMREAYETIPPDMKMRPVSQSFTDPPSKVMQRCSLELIYLKSIIVLNRRFLDREALDPKYAKFRSACLDAAMQMLARQADLDQACRPGGQLSADKWMVSSLTAHDFLLAAMVVCLQLSVNMRTTAAASRNADFSRHFDALKLSQKIWSSKSESKEAHTAAQALELMIRKVESRNVSNSGPSSQLPQDDASILQDLNLPYAEPMTEMIDGSENLDWALLDQYFQNPNRLDDFSSPTYDQNLSTGSFPNTEPEWMI